MGVFENYYSYYLDYSNPYYYFDFFNGLKTFLEGVFLGTEGELIEGLIERNRGGLINSPYQLYTINI